MTAPMRSANPNTLRQPNMSIKMPPTIGEIIGPMVAPPLGGLLVDHLGWRSVFWFAALVGAVVSVAAWIELPETRRPTAAARSSILRDYRVLFADRRFTAFVLQSGFMSGTFFATAAAAPFLMHEALGRSATEFGLYFFLYPAGFCAGNFLSSRLAGRVAIEPMVLVGALFNFLAIGVEAALLLGGYLSPLAIFVPGFFITFGQGLALPNAQAGAIQAQPPLAGTAAGIGAFCQALASAIFVQLYGFFANGTVMPMVAVAASSAVLAVLCGIVPMMGRRAPR